MSHNQKTSNKTKPLTIWQYLTEPPVGIVDEQLREQVRLFLAILTLLIPLGLLIVAGNFLIAKQSETFMVSFAALGTLMLVFGLCRKGFVKTSFLIATLIYPVGSFIIVLLEPSETYVLPYLAISFVFSALFLLGRETLYLVFFQLIGVLLLPIIKPTVAAPKVIENLGFLTIIGILATIVAIVRERSHSRVREQSELLVHSELRYRAIVEDQHDSICRYNSDFVLTFVNEAFCNHYRKDQSELLAQTIFTLIPQAEWEQARSRLQQISIHNPVVTFEYQMHTDDGKIEWHEWIDRGIFDARGNITEYQAVGRDITERKLAEEAVKESTTRYRTLFEGIEDAVYVHDLDGQICDVNEVACQRMGYSRADLLTMNITDLLSPSNQEKYPSRLQQVIKQGSLTGLSSIHVTKNGDACHVDVNAKSISYQGRDAVLVVARDLSPRLKAEFTIQLQQARLRALHEVIARPDLDFSEQLDVLVQVGTELLGLEIGIVSQIDGEDYTVQHIFATNAMFSKGQQQRLANTYCSITTTSNDVVAIHHIGETKYRTHPYYQSTHIEAYIGTPIHVNGQPFGTLNFSSLTPFSAPFTDGDKDFVRLMGKWVNTMLERQQSAAEREALIRELDAFAHTVAHDLKNPLGIITGYVEMLQEIDPNPDLVQEISAILSKTSRKMARIVNELLKLAELRDREDIEIAPLNMEKIVTEALLRLARLIDAHKSQIEVPPSWHTAVGYAAWIEEIWVNYISNAVKYGGNPPCIELGSDDLHDGSVRFWVKDNGSGLSPDEQETLFTEFTRIHPTNIDGHGLGLSIVRRIAERLGGTVGVESNIGDGSTFFFILPTVDVEQQPETHPN